MRELVAYYLDQIRAINTAISEQFADRGAPCGETFPTASASELVGKLAERAKDHA